MFNTMKTKEGGMRQIFTFEGDELLDAWIGGSAPIPGGWHIDRYEAQNAAQSTAKSEPEVVEEAPKPRGRPKKA